MRILERIAPRELTGSRAIIASLMGAALTMVCAQLAVYLPGNPVPVTLQVFAAILCGMALGGRLGMLSQIEYLAAGAAGLPVFAGFKAGWPVLAGPTGGYLVGMVAAAFVVGSIVEKAKLSDFRLRVIAGLIGVFVIYTFGRAWLAVWMGDPTGIGSWILGIAPFVAVDCLKVLAAAAICPRR